MAFEPFSVVLAAFTASSRSTDIFFEDGGRIVMQIGRPQISFYLILRMANLGSKAREKGQNYKDLGLLPLSLTSNEAPRAAR